MQIYIVVILVSLTLIAILFFALRSTVKRIDYNTRKYFIDKLQDYDYLIEDKQKILNELNEKIEKNKEIIKSDLQKPKQIIKEQNKKYYNDIKMPKYMDEKLFQKYKDIKNKFSFNYEKIIKNFLDTKLSNENSDYDIIVKIREKFSNKVIFEILKLRLNQQHQYIYNMLLDNEKDILKKYINIENMKIKNLIIKLDTIIEKIDPTVYIFCGDKNKNYDYISPKIKTVFDNNINEGIKINYKGILYDYSI